MFKMFGSLKEDIIFALILKIYILLFLFICAFIDKRQKEIPLFLPIIGFIISLILSILARELSVLQIVLGCVLGIVALLLAKLTKQAIGYGDGMILICTGAALGLWKNLIILCIALVICACTCALLMFARRKKKKDDIAFIPFLFSGYVVSIALFL